MAPSPPAVPGRRNFAVLWTANFITSLGMMGFIPLIPLHLRLLGVEDPGALRVWSGVLTAGAPLVAAFMGPVWGSLGDRVGRKLMIQRAQLAIIVFVGAAGLVGSPWQLLGLRLAQGLFSGYMAPAMTLVSVTAPAERQGRSMAWLQTAILCGAAVGALVGGQVADTLGLTRVYGLCAGLSALSFLLVTAFVVEPPREPAEAPAGGGKAPLLRGVARDIGAMARNRTLRGILLGVFAVRFGASLVEPVMALFVETLEGVDPARLATATGFVFSGQALANLAVTPLWGRVGDRWGHRRILAFCAGGGALCFVAQALVGHLWALLGLRLLAGALLAGIVPAAYAAAARHSSTGQRGGAYGFTFSSVILARALGLLAGGWLAADLGLRPLFVLAAACMAVAVVGALMALRSGRDPAAD